MHCEKCGHLIKDNDKFCEKCGAPSPVSKAEAKPSTPKLAAAPKPKKEVDEKTQKQRKILAIIALVILVLGFGAYKVGESMTSRERIIDNFISAIAEKDPVEIAKFIKPSGPGMEVNEGTLKPLIDYMDENPSYLHKLTESIREQSENFGKSTDNDKKDRPAMSKNEDSNIISLKKKGKKFLLYDNYQLEIKPFFIKVSTNYKDAVIFLNGKQVDVSDSENFTKEIGPLLPGLYTLKSVYTGEYTTIESEQKVELIVKKYSEDSKIVSTRLDLNAKYIYINTNNYDANVVVNGKDIGLTAQEVNENGLGPVDDTTIIQLSKEFPWGNILTDEITAEGSSQLKITMTPINNEVKDQIMGALNKFNVDAVNANEQRNAELVVNATANKMDSIRNSIENLFYYEKMYKGFYQRAAFDLDSLRIYTENDIYKAKITVSEDYLSAYYYESEEIPELEESTLIWEYTLFYDITGKRWLINDNYRKYSFSDNNIKEFNFTK